MSAETPAQQRAFLIHTARIYMTEARARRKRHPEFARTLLAWAAKARRDAAQIDIAPAQMDLFG